MIQNNPANDLQSFVSGLPKTETHLHIEGALPFELVHNLDPDTFKEPPASWGADFKFATFEQFEGELLAMATRWYTSPERYYESAKLIFAGLVEHNVKYLETSFHAGIIEHLDVPGREILAAIKAAIPENLEVRVFMGMLRNHYNEKMAPILDDCVNWDGLDGIDLHGVEVLAIESWTERLWAAAQEAGMETKAHAGEFGGADYVREAIERLGVRRVQHGIRAGEDPEVVRLAVQTDTTFDICPISNVKLAVVPSMKEHPIRALFDAGVRCTVSTDDPVSFGNTMTDEYMALGADLFTRAELAKLAKNGFEAALLQDDRKAVWLAELDGIIDRCGESV